MRGWMDVGAYRIIHIQIIQILALHGGEAKHRDDEGDPPDGHGADGFGPAA